MNAAPLGPTANGEHTARSIPSASNPGGATPGLEPNSEHSARSTDTPPPSGRDAHGRFAKGNPGGPGNAFARQTAAFHRAFRSVVSVEDIQAFALKLKELALAGNLAALKLMLSYTVGRPQAAANPDTLDLQEWEQLRQAPAMLQEMNTVIQSLTAEDACTIARNAQPLVSQELCTQFSDGLQRQEEAAQRQRARRQEREERRQQAREERAARRERIERPAETSSSPSPSGGIGADRFASMTPEEILEEIRTLARQQRSEAPRSQGLAPGAGAGRSTPPPLPFGRNGRET